MSQVQAETKVKAEDGTVTKKTAVAEYDIPESLDALRAKFGDEVVAHAAVNSVTIALQNFMRQNIDDAPDALQAKVSAWIPGVRARGPKKSAFEKASEALSSLNPDQVKELIAKMKAQLTGK